MRWRLLISALVVLLAFSSSSAQTVDLASGNPGTPYHTQAATIAPILKRRADIDIRIQTLSSPKVYLPVVGAGEIEFGIASVHLLMLALEGTARHTDRTSENLRLVAVTAPLRATFFAKKDSPIKTLADLKGKRVGWEYSRQPTAMKMVEALFSAAGLKQADVARIPVASTAHGADEFAAGKTDAFFFALGAAKVAEVDARVGGIGAIPLPDTPQARAALGKTFPAAYLLGVEPAFGHAGIHEPTRVLAYDVAIFTHAGAADGLVYRMTKALYENARSLSGASPTLRGFAPAAMAKDTDPIRYHPGAIKLYEEKGLWPPK